MNLQKQTYSKINLYYNCIIGIAFICFAYFLILSFYSHSVKDELLQSNIKYMDHIEYEYRDLYKEFYGKNFVERNTFTLKESNFSNLRHIQLHNIFPEDRDISLFNNMNYYSELIIHFSKLVVFIILFGFYLSFKLHDELFKIGKSQQIKENKMALLSFTGFLYFLISLSALFVFYLFVMNDGIMNYTYFISELGEYALYGAFISLISLFPSIYKKEQMKLKGTLIIS